MADDIIIQAQSTLFGRQGQTRQQKGYVYNGPGLSVYNGVAAAVQEYDVSAQKHDAEQTAMANTVSQDPEILPGGLTLYQIQALDATLFPGAAELKRLYELDPFSTEFEVETQALYDRQYATARTAAVSGPSNVRGGTARQGFELADLDTQQSINRFHAVRQHQLAIAQIVIAATQMANQAEGERRSAQLRSQQQQAATEQGRVMQILSAAEQLAKDKELWIRSLAAGGEFLASPLMVTEEAIQGQGFQGAVNTGFGMSYWR